MIQTGRLAEKLTLTNGKANRNRENGLMKVPAQRFVVSGAESRTTKKGAVLAAPFP